MWPPMVGDIKEMQQCQVIGQTLTSCQPQLQRESININIAD